MDLAEVLKIVNENPISPEEMGKFVSAMANDEEEPCFDRFCVLSDEVFNEDSEKSLSAMIRIAALLKLIEHKAFPPEWVEPLPGDGRFHVFEKLYMAAGQEPMIKLGSGDSDLYFDCDKLVERTFRLWLGDESAEEVIEFIEKGLGKSKDKSRDKFKDNFKRGTTEMEKWLRKSEAKITQIEKKRR